MESKHLLLNYDDPFVKHCGTLLQIVFTRKKLKKTNPKHNLLKYMEDTSFLTFKLKEEHKEEFRNIFGKNKIKALEKYCASLEEEIQNEARKKWPYV